MALKSTLPKMLQQGQPGEQYTSAFPTKTTAFAIGATFASGPATGHGPM
jgi:hypothetical protein